MSNEEQNVLDNFTFDISLTENIDSINKLYRQARVWVRFHWRYAEACSKEHATEINKQLKAIRLKRFDELNYITKTGRNKNAKQDNI